MFKDDLFIKLILHEQIPFKIICYVPIIVGQQNLSHFDTTNISAPGKSLLTKNDEFHFNPYNNVFL